MGGYICKDICGRILGSICGVNLRKGSCEDLPGPCWASISSARRYWLALRGSEEHGDIVDIVTKHGFKQYCCSSRGCGRLFFLCDLTFESNLWARVEFAGAIRVTIQVNAAAGSRNLPGLRPKGLLQESA